MSIDFDDTLRSLSLRRSQRALTPYDLEEEPTDYCNVTLQVSSEHLCQLELQVPAKLCQNVVVKFNATRVNKRE